MILRSIQVRNWRCFIGSVTVGPFDAGLNVLHAPNATGKSTLFEALLRGLLDAHRVTGRDIEAVRPWARDLAPKVTIEFAHEGTDYRVTKGFLEAAEAALERKENGRFRLVAEGDAADAQVRAILRSSPPGRGLARPENWGLAQVLWAPQGNLAIGSLSGDVLADIRVSLGAQVSGAGAGPVEERIERAYGQFFTPGGRLKTGRDAPAVVNLRGELAAAVERRAVALQQQQAFEEAARRVEDLRARRAQARHDAEAITKTLKEARARADSYKALLSEKKERTQRQKAAEAQYNELKQRIDAVKAARRELGKAQESLRKLEASMPLQMREVANREEQAAEMKAALEDARKGRQAVDDAQENAEQARRFLQAQKMLGNIDDRLTKIAKAQKALATHKRERARLVAPDAKVLRAVRKAIKGRDEAQVRIDAALTTLEIVPKKKGTLTIVAGEKTGKLPLRPGKPAQIKGSPEVVADLPGVARLRAWGPAGSIEQHREERAKAVRKLKELTEPYGTADLEELDSLMDKARELDGKIAEAETRMETLLSDASVEGIEQEQAQVEAVQANILEQHPDWAKDPPDSEALGVAAADRKDSFIATVETAEARWYAAQTALTAATTHRGELAGQLKQTKAQVKSLESRLTGLTEDGKEDQEREAQLRRMALSWEAARISLEETEEKLSAFSDDPVAAAEKLDKQLEAAHEAATRAIEDEKTQEGRLEHLSAQGPYSTLAQAEEEVAELERRISEEELRVAAIRLIHEMVAQCRVEALTAVAAPVEAAATRTLQRIAGTRLGRVQLGRSFEPSHVLSQVAASPVPLDSVSGGEREQIYLATRLALAEVLARDERQLVVLDDVLTFTDTGRLARVMTVLEEAAQRLQLLILTCHPERYRGLEQAHFLDLEAIVRASVAG